MVKQVKRMTNPTVIIVVFLVLALSFPFFGFVTGAFDEPGSAVEEAEPAAQPQEQVALADEAGEETAETPTEETVDECLTCHIDKEMLIATADPEEEVISESEGEG